MCDSPRTVSHRTVSVGSTPTLPHCAAVPGVTEVRPGNYVFHDAIQLALGVAAIDNCALNVLTTVLAAYPDRFVIDGGSKTFALDRGAHGLERAPGHGRIIGHPDWVVARLSEEHGVVTVPPGSAVPPIGTRLRVIPNHACAVVNLHSQLHVVRGGDLIDTWPVKGRY